MHILHLIIAAILGLAVAVESHAQTSPDDLPQTVSPVQGKFDRALPRVEAWVRSLLGRTDPIIATVEILDAESFASRAPDPEHEAREQPLLMVAVITPDAEILINEPAFDAMSERAEAEGLFADDVVMLIVAHELTHAAHLDMLPPIGTGPYADEQSAEEAAAALIMREAHAAMIQRSIAVTIGGDSLEKFSRDAYESTPLAPARNTLANAGIQILERALEEGGTESVNEVLENPPTSLAQILQRASPQIDLAAALSDQLLQELPDSDWFPVTRRGPEAAIGQGWRWMSQQDREAIRSTLQDSFLVALIDRGASTPKMVSVTVLEFESPGAAEAGLERLASPIELMASRFGYAPSGEKRATDLIPNGDGWLKISGEHPMPGGTQAFGVLAVRQLGSRVIIFNGTGAPGSVVEATRLLRLIAESA